MTKAFFDKYIIANPFRILCILLLGVIFLGYYCTKLEIDASSETLLLDNDKDLKFAREVSQNYHLPEFLIVTYTPKNTPLLSNTSLKNIKSLSAKLLKVENINEVTSILNVPLFQSPIQSISSLLSGGIKTLESSKVNKNLAKKEFLESPIYKDNLVSADFKSTALVLNLKTDEKYMKLVGKRNALLAKKRLSTITQKQKEELKKVSEDFKIYRDIQREKNHQNILKIRQILKQYQKDATIFLGGVNMIANDIIGFIKGDLIIYGSTLIVLLAFMLWVIFRKLIWVFLPLLICLLSVVSTTGILGLFHWEVSIISSNFIALQLIITISVVLHLIVRYRELSLKYTNSSQYKLVINTILSKLNPSFFAIITTIAGFGSLILSGIKPVKNLGWMMSAGVSISLIITFIIFATILIMTKRLDTIKQSKFRLKIMSWFSLVVEKYPLSIFLGSIIIVIFSLTGASKLIVENSFINYFKKSTQIYKGMEVIDNKLGGTTPLDIILTFNSKEKKSIKVKNNDEEDDFSSFEEEFAKSQNNPEYWFTKDKMNIILRVHNYLESIPQIGKVQSLATVLKVGKLLNKNKNLDGLSLAILYNKLPKKYKDIILNPYINIQKNQARISTRIIDSNPNLRRNDLIKKLKRELPFVIDDSNVKLGLSNLMILYNNMLQSLFSSQIETLGFVVAILFLMFLILFRSVLVSFIAILTNIIPISIIFGIMGWLNIPLNIMTITIAAISIGIGVDNTIHYIHRFHKEYKKDYNYIKAMKRCHETIAYAMVYTSSVIVIGLSILTLSNLIPTIYFGFLTAIVMLAMLTSALLLLPRLIISFKPYIKR